MAYGDLNLATPQGAKLMIRRLDEAAADVCGAPSFSAREYKQAVRSSACYQDSMNRAAASLGSPSVNAIYRQHTVTVASKLTAERQHGGLVELLLSRRRPGQAKPLGCGALTPQREDGSGA